MELKEKKGSAVAALLYAKLSHVFPDGPGSIWMHKLADDYSGALTAETWADGRDELVDRMRESGDCYTC